MNLDMLQRNSNIEVNNRKIDIYRPFFIYQAYPTSVRLHCLYGAK